MTLSQEEWDRRQAEGSWQQLPDHTPAPKTTDVRDFTGTAPAASGNGHKPAVRPDRPTTWTAAELMAANFPPPRWAVPDLLVEGATVLAGAPKAGKSWLALNLAVSVATGGPALGQIEVDPGPALYLALEDTPRRLQDRLGKILRGQTPAPETLTISIECPPLSAGGTERLADWLTNHPDARLVVIDVLARMRGPRLRDDSIYAADYALATEIKKIADEYHVAILVVHHTRKAGAEDWIDTISGSQGIAGGVDAIAVLKRMRGQVDGVLSVTGRDIEDVEHALRFSADLGSWHFSGIPVADLHRTEGQRQIVSWLIAHEGDGPIQVAKGTGLDYELVKKSMRRLAERGELDSDGHGHYWAVPEGEGNT
jgi:AAA domain